MEMDLLLACCSLEHQCSLTTTSLFNLILISMLFGKGIIKNCAEKRIFADPQSALKLFLIATISFIKKDAQMSFHFSRLADFRDC